MNERILELAKRCGYWSGQTIEMNDVGIRMFAELMVKECTNIIGEENYNMLTGKAYCAQLKRHFGVEE